LTYCQHTGSATTHSDRRNFMLKPGTKSKHRQICIFSVKFAYNLNLHHVGVNTGIAGKSFTHEPKIHLSDRKLAVISRSVRVGRGARELHDRAPCSGSLQLLSPKSINCRTFLITGCSEGNLAPHTFGFPSKVFYASATTCQRQREISDNCEGGV
jgi:hypothetical protein